MPPAVTGKVEVTIRIDSSPSVAFQEVVERLRAAGLTELQAHPRFHMVNGFAPSTLLEKLDKVAGVVGVRRSGKFGAR